MSGYIGPSYGFGSCSKAPCSCGMFSDGKKMFHYKNCPSYKDMKVEIEPAPQSEGWEERFQEKFGIFIDWSDGDSIKKKELIVFIASEITKAEQRGLELGIARDTEHDKADRQAALKELQVAVMEEVKTLINGWACVDSGDLLTNLTELFKRYED